MVCGAPRRGFTLVWLAMVMVMLMGMASLAVDYGRVQVVKTQLRRAVDAAARYGAAGLSGGNAVAWAKLAAADNQVNGVAFSLADSDIQTGNYSSGTFTSGGTPLNAIKIIKTSAVPLLFGQAVGQRNCNVTAASMTGSIGQKYGLAGLGSVTISNCTIDGYDSSQGSYASTHGNTAHIASNGNVSVSGATVGGDAQPGPSGTFSGSVGQVTGTTAKLAAALNYPAPSAGSYATTNDNANVATHISSGSFSMNSGTVSMPAGTYYFTNFNVMGGTLNCTGPVTIYVTGNMQIASTCNAYQNVPANFKILGTGSGTFQVTAGGTTYVYLYAPAATVKLLSSGTFYGALVGNTLQIMAGAVVHEDDSLYFGNGGAVSLLQ